MKSVFLASFLALAGPLFGQAPAQDFSKGFALLAGLGLPPLDSTATWVKVGDSNRMDYQLREYLRSSKGNSWLIRSKDGAFKQLPLGGLEAQELPPKGKELPPQDVEKDVDSIIDLLTKAAAKMDPDDMMSGYRYSGFESLLIFSTQLHQTGRKDLANRLAHATFAFFPTRENAINAVVNRIAEQSYEKTASDFFASGDWAAYHRDLSSLAERFPRGWSSCEAARLMLPQLARQAKGDTAPDPALPGTTIAPEAVAILRELMQPPKRETKPQEIPEGMPIEAIREMQMMRSMGHDFSYGGNSRFHQYLWLISEGAPNASDPQSRLAKLGMAALPALASVAEDPFFTYQRNANASGHSYYSHESGEERTARAYRSMDRPATRGEIATSMLALTLPDPDNQLREADAQTLRDAAMDFWKAHHKSSREQIAALFLKEGSAQQASQATEVLAQSKNPDAHKMFEDHVLAADPAISHFNSVQTYLKARKAEGKPFFDRYAQLVRKQTADAGGDGNDGSDPFGGSSNPYSWQIKEAGGVEKILKQLQALAEGESPRAMAIRIGKEETIKTAPAAIGSLMQAMDAEEPKNQLIALLSGAYSASKDENVRALFLKAIFRISWGKGDVDVADGGDENAEDTKKKPATREISEAEAKVWQRLIGDSRPLKNSRGPGDYGMGFTMPTVSALACAALESSVSVGHEYYQLMGAIPILARPAADIMTERAQARLAGKAVPPLPDAKKITPARLAAIVSEAGGKPANELHTYLGTLTMDERAAWAEWLAEPGDLAFPDNVKQLILQVVKLADAAATPTQAIPDFQATPVGFQISEKSINNLIQTVAANSDKYSRGVIGFSSADFGPGLEVGNGLFPIPEPANKDEEVHEDPYSDTLSTAQMFYEALNYFKEDDQSDAFITADIQTGSGNEEAAWTVKAGKITRYRKDGEEDADDSFAQLLKSLTENNGPSRFYLTIKILSRADAGKINTNNE